MPTRHEIRSLALEHTKAALEELGRLAKGASSEASRIAAIKELLDRACGKTAAASERAGDAGEETPRLVVTIERRLVRPVDGEGG